jgi:hypothetical protein
MMSNHLLKVFLLPLLFIYTYSFAQRPEPDTLFLTSAITNAKKLYVETINGQARLYNGSDYLEYKPVEAEHPYFTSDDWVLSTVEYAGEYFSNVPILYDINTDQVITEHYYSNNKMVLTKELLSSFTFQNRLFVRLDKNSSKNFTLKTGFYELLYNGQTKAYSRRTKDIQKRISADKYDVSFDEKTRYYIYKNESYYEVSSKASMLQLFSDKKHELKRLLKEDHIRFKTDKEKAIVAILKYYEGINR